MRKLALSAAAISLCLFFATHALAIDMSSDMVSTANNQKHTSKIYMQGAKMRMESPQQPGYSIVRPDRNVMWMVMPEQKSYMEMPLDPSRQPKTSEKVQGEVSRKLLGSETIDGHHAQKYEVTYKDRESSQKMYQWMATDINFPVKMAAIDGSWTVEYRNIKMGAQPDSLFEVPAGFQKTGVNLPDMSARGGLKESPSEAQQSEAGEGQSQESAGESGGLKSKLPKLGIPKLPKF